MTKANMQFCNKVDSSMIFTIKNMIGGWPDKFQDIVFKITKASDISSVMVKVAPLEKRIFEKVMFCFEKGYVFSISSGVRGLS